MLSLSEEDVCVVCRECVDEGYFFRISNRDEMILNILLINGSISFTLIMHLVFADLQLCQTSTYKILPLLVLKGD